MKFRFDKILVSGPSSKNVKLAKEKKKNTNI